MATEQPGSTQGYAQEAPALIEQYESLSFADVHASVLHLIPSTPGRVLDIGSGTGRDAAALAAMGHRVTAVEPTAEFRHPAQALHPSPLIDWLDDSLPDLARLSGFGEHFDAVMLTAVWMHLDEAQRRHAMPRVASLIRRGGVMLMSLRHGPVPPGRRMFDVSGEETTQLARAAGLRLELALDNQSGTRRRPGVTWTRLAFCKPR